MESASGQRLGRDYWRFWAAAAASNLGDGIRLGALPLLALSLTTDARLIGGVVSATTLPWLILGPIAGVIVDRRDRRTIMFTGQVARAALMAMLVALIAFDAVTIWWVYIAAFGLGCGEVFVDSSSQAAIPQLVLPDQLDRANAHLLAAVTVLDQVVGVAVGAALFTISSEMPFAVDAATFLVGGVLLLSIRRPLQGVRSEDTRVLADIAEGFRFLFGHKLLRGLVGAVAMSNLAATTSFAVLVILVVEELGTPQSTFGLVLGFGAVGGIIGSLVAGRLVDTLGRRVVLSSMPFLLAVGFLANAIAPSAWIVAAAYFVISFSIIAFNIAGRALRQAVTPEHLLGRVVTTFRMTAVGVVPVGGVFGGLITEATSVRVTNIVAAAGMAIAALWMVRAMRHLSTDSH